MPKLVDHEAKRAEIFEAARRVIARDGLEAATVRAISTEAGYSTGVLTRYFATKDDVIEGALRVATERFRSTISEFQDRRGLEAVRALLHAEHQHDEAGRTDTRVWLAFWSHAASSARLRTLSGQLYRRWRSVFQDHLTEAIADGELGPHIDPASAALSLTCISDGLAVQSATDDQQWTEQQLHLAIDTALAMLVASSHTAQPAQSAPLVAPHTGRLRTRSDFTDPATKLSPPSNPKSPIANRIEH